MNVKKGSKNAIENRGVAQVITCKVCNTEKKPFRMMGTGQNRIVFECKCGITDKAGNKI